MRIDGGVSCQWLDAGDIRFTDPFFEDTLTRCRSGRSGRRVLPLHRLHEEAAAASAIMPSAFIFHVSRCASTLLSQLFACDERTVVLSEVPLLDELLRSDLADRDALFVSALRLLGRRRDAHEARFVVKTDCWHLFYAANLRRLYPATPFVLLYRDPEDVLASHHRVRGMQMVPGLLERAPFAVEYDSARLTLDQYTAKVLEQHYRQMIEVAAGDPGALLVSYGEGFPAVFERIARWMELPLDDRLRARIRERSTYDGKAPVLVFEDRAREPLPGVDVGALRDLFDQLEQLRLLP